MTTYYWEVADVHQSGRIEAESDEEARSKSPKNFMVLYKESNTKNGLPLILVTVNGPQSRR